MFAFAKNKSTENLIEIFKTIDEINIPIFSIKRIDIINLGLKDYSKISDIMDSLKNIWIESNFSATNENLLEKSKEMF